MRELDPRYGLSSDVALKANGSGFDLVGKEGPPKENKVNSVFESARMALEAKEIGVLNFSQNLE